MKGPVSEIVHDPGCGVLLVRAVFRDITSLSSRRNCSWQRVLSHGPSLGNLASGSLGTSGKDPDGLTSLCGRKSEQIVPLDVGGARHSENDVSKRASMSRADMDSPAKPAHDAWAPALVRDCAVPKSMNEDTWHDDSCTVKPRPCRPPTRCQKEPPFQMWRSSLPCAVPRRTLQAHRA